MFQECFNGVLRVYQPSLKGVKWNFQASFKQRESMEVNVCFNSVGYFKGFSRVFKGVSRTFQGCFLEISWVF